MAKSTCTFTLNGDIIGSVSLFQAKEDSTTTIEGTLTKLKPGRHGFHIHAYGDIDGDLSGVGPIFNPFGKNHGAPDDEERMVGDLGNIEVNENGEAKIVIDDHLVKLIGPHSVIGRSIVIKENEDDLGRGGNENSLNMGNSGAKISGGVIGISATK
mmetsp:Transcript_443/g.632  ORF Transcript_443/g.632 Transcript_443/m.632 type:complete len:156 (-) Transcript_443:27-494(-)